MRSIKPSKQLVVITLVYVSGLCFFALTNPNKLPLVALIVPFVYMFLVFNLTIRYLGHRLGITRANFIALLLSTLGVLLFILGSLHQLTLSDAIISLALSLMVGWYISRLSR